MVKVFRSVGHDIDLVACSVSYQGQSIKIRPKTFQLLQLLISSPGEVISKAQILGEVWADVHTDEQVIFQSIKELRKIFVGREVIKTHPRKGYAWVKPVTRVENNEAPALKNTAAFFRLGSPKVLGAMAAALCISMALLFTLQSSTPNPQGSVIVLPVTSELSDTDHVWVRYGAMDQLIQRLRPSDRYGVLQTDDVLDVMKRAGLPADDYSRTDLNKIFSVSGASLIVESRLAGVPNEYQLLYTLHQRGDMERGVILADTIGRAMNELAEVLGNKMSIHVGIGNPQYGSSFANEMLAAALEQIRVEDSVSAEKFLEAAISIEPENVVPKRLLAEILIHQKRYQKADEILREGMALAQKLNNQRELARLGYGLGVSMVNRRMLGEGLETLSRAEQQAKSIKDWLYLAYISAAKGKIFQLQEDYLKAEQAYVESIDFHQVIQCPFGRAQGLLYLTELAFEQQNYDLARQHNRQFLSLIEERELPNLKSLADSWTDKLRVMVSPSFPETLTH